MKTYNKELDNIDTPEKAYLLGFLYGDGCITKKHVTKLSINEKDEELIDKIMIFFPFFNKGSFDYSKYNKNSGIQKFIRSSSKELFYDLQKHGLLTRKSYENKEFLSIPKLNENLMRDFIRGFFDADGSVFKMKYRCNLYSISITSNSLKLINGINNHLKENNIIAWQVRIKEPSGKGKQVYYEISIIKREEIKKFKEYIYTDSELFLKRKKNIFNEFRIVEKVIERDILCPKCNSKKTIKNGTRKNKTREMIRMICFDCNQGFSIVK